MRKILFYQSDFLWYRHELMQSISSIPDVSLIVCYGNLRFSISNHTLLYKLFKILEFKTKFFWYIDYWTPFFRHRPDQVILSQNPYIISTIPFLLFCKLFNVKVLLRGHGGLKQNLSYIEYIYRKLFYLLSDSYISYTKYHANEVSNRYNIPVIKANNTLLPTPPFNHVPSNLDLDFLGSNYFIYTGSLESYKRVEQMLISIFDLCDSNFSLVVVGSGSLFDRLDFIVKTNTSPLSPNIYLLGNIPDSSLLSYLISQSLAAVCYGDLGLQVVHALACGKPIFALNNACSSINHSPEYIHITESGIGSFFDSDTSLTSYLQDYNPSIEHSTQISLAARQYYLQNLSITSLASSHIIT